MDELKPCPFCDHNDVFSTYGTDLHGRCFWIECRVCRACGTVRRSRIDAINAWNTRTGDNHLPEIGPDPEGDHQLVPVEEYERKEARIAELERLLEKAKDFILIRTSSKNYPITLIDDIGEALEERDE